MAGRASIMYWENSTPIQGIKTFTGQWPCRYQTAISDVNLSRTNVNVKNLQVLQINVFLENQFG